MTGETTTPTSKETGLIGRSLARLFEDDSLYGKVLRVAVPYVTILLPLLTGLMVALANAQALNDSSWFPWLKTTIVDDLIFWGVLGLWNMHLAIRGFTTYGPKWQRVEEEDEEVA